MKVVVTGGAGYIGSVVAAALVARGDVVVVVDDLSKGHADAVPEGATFVPGDLLDGRTLASAITEDVDAVLHFAARSLVGESMGDPAGYFRTNLGGTLELLDAMRAVGARRLVFSSTAAVYGAPDEIPIVETAPTVPTNPYGASKLAMDQLIAYEAAAHDLGAVSLRYFNVAGASGTLRERHDPETHLIPLVLDVAAGDRERVQIYGTDYATPDGTAVRDYIHVEDLARAHLLALDATAEGGHRTYNLGNGNGYSVREVVDAAGAVTGADIAVEETARRAGDPPVLVASSARIRQELGWVPAKPSLEAMIGDAWAARQGA